MDALIAMIWFHFLILIVPGTALIATRMWQRHRARSHALEDRTSVAHFPNLGRRRKAA